MEPLSRRRILIAGGTIGALGALSAVPPAQARSLWSWSPSGSVAGTGQGTDPAWVWDEEADQLLASVIDRGDVPKVNQLLRSWKRNDQPLPAGLPRDVREFVEAARRLPAWADQGRLDAAARFNTTKGIYVGTLYGLGSGLMSTAIPREARAVYYSKGGADMKDRIAKTARLGYDVGDLDAYQPQGAMIVTAVKTRLVHAAVRHLLPKSPGWTETSGGQKIPISQADMLVTWHSLPTFVMRRMLEWKVRAVQGAVLGAADQDRVATHRGLPRGADSAADGSAGGLGDGGGPAKVRPALPVRGQADQHRDPGHEPSFLNLAPS